MKTVKNEVELSAAMRENFELVKRAVERVYECFAVGSEKTKIDLAPDAVKTIVLFEKSKVGGYVFPHRHGNKVFLNWSLLKENEERYMKITIPHEVCHLFASKHLSNIGRREGAHGLTWKRFMVHAFGLQPLVYHNMDVTSARRDVKTFKYICACQKHEISTVLHKRMQNGKVYRCRKCRSSLTILA